MLNQFKGILSDAVLRQSSLVLIEQAILLAMQKKIEWRRADANTLEAEILIGLPGEEAMLTPVFLWRSCSDGGTWSCYLQLENKEDGVCRNDGDKRIKVLVEETFH